MKVFRDSKELLVTVIIILMLWEGLTQFGVINTVFLPPPSEIFLAAPKNAEKILGSFLVTLKHIAIGYSIGSLLGITLGALSGWYDWFDKSLGNIVNAIYPIPRITYLPLFILWFGYNETPIIAVIGLTTFFPVYINTLSGIKKADRRLIEVGMNLGANKLGILRKVVFPSSLPYITTGLRLAIGRSVTSAIAAEMIAGLMGLGGVIYLAGEFFKPEVIILSQIVIALFGLTIYRLFDVIEYRYILRWMPRTENR